MAKPPSFEDAIKTLETCVEHLEQDDLPIDEALKHFETGVKNIQRCQKALKGARLKIEQLTRDQNQQLTTETLDL
ncbi:exodeoxyribonuclease VII small subunit [uncultured Desulfuromonas sp.]|uniref:exodeoxyribonuclease VII small subunit n=1 Tax=uncultured Desulfuromonas sp. TaxID=181013 RepID=UPI002AABB07F|nr:exodeoxyribonuclease VII small subunit [uncultured Desulfuromonas sp.]